MVLLGKADSKMKNPAETLKGDKVEAKKGRYKEKWREYFDGPINLDLNRPQTNQLGAVKQADPKKLFSSIPDLKNNRAVIDEIIDAQEELNMCTDLTKTLDIHTSQKLLNVPGLNTEYRRSLKERRKTLTVLRDPTYIPKSKFINESKMLQLAFLDKIIEECDDDQNHNRIGEIVQRAQSFVDT